MREHRSREAALPPKPRDGTRQGIIFGEAARFDIALQRGGRIRREGADEGQGLRNVGIIHHHSRNPGKRRDLLHGIGEQALPLRRPADHARIDAQRQGRSAKGGGEHEFPPQRPLDIGGRFHGNPAFREQGVDPRMGQRSIALRAAIDQRWFNGERFDEQTCTVDMTWPHDMGQDREAMKAGSWSGFAAIEFEDVAMAMSLNDPYDRNSETLVAADIAVTRLRQTLYRAVQAHEADGTAPGADRSDMTGVIAYDRVVLNSEDWKTV